MIPEALNESVKAKIKEMDGCKAREPTAGASTF